MNRLQKKCFLFSTGAHGLLAVILIATAAFRTSPPKNDSQILEFIPAAILDRPGSGGHTMAMAAVPHPQPVQAQPPAPVQPAPQPPQPAVVQTPEPIERIVPRVEQPKVHTPIRVREQEDTIPERDSPAPVPVKHHHEIKPTFTPVEKSSTASSNAERRNAAAARERAERAERAAERAAEAHRAEAIENALSGLASNVKSRAGEAISVNLEGAGGGEEAFAGYETVVKSVYFNAWKTPDDLSDRLANVDAKIVVARDGSILSTEVLARSGHHELDRTVERVLRAVTKLPPFPESAKDSERTFVLRFNLEAKLSG
jgi:TonB family protein